MSTSNERLVELIKEAYVVLEANVDEKYLLASSYRASQVTAIRRWKEEQEPSDKELQEALTFAKRKGL